VEVTTLLRRSVKRAFPWTIPVYEKMQAVKRDISSMYPLRQYDTVYGFKLVGPDCRFIESQSDGTYEPGEVAWMAGTMRKVDAFIDCGANVGLYTMLALKTGILAIAIEPQRKNVQAIKAGLKANGYECRIAPVALSNREGTATLHGMSSGSASLLANWHTEISAIHRTVATATLDNLLRSQFDKKRLLIKMDLEGHEWEALCGALRTLARTPRPIWMVEIVDFAHKGGVHPHKADIFSLFARHGYAAREIAPGNWGFE
jgi:FkbM family methyltransferase